MSPYRFGLVAMAAGNGDEFVDGLETIVVVVDGR